MELVKKFPENILIFQLFWLKISSKENILKILWYNFLHFILCAFFSAFYPYEGRPLKYQVLYKFTNVLKNKKLNNR